MARGMTHSENGPGRSAGHAGAARLDTDSRFEKNPRVGKTAFAEVVITACFVGGFGLFVASAGMLILLIFAELATDSDVRTCLWGMGEGILLAVISLLLGKRRQSARD